MTEDSNTELPPLPPLVLDLGATPAPAAVETDAAIEAPVTQSTATEPAQIAETPGVQSPLTEEPAAEAAVESSAESPVVVIPPVLKTAEFQSPVFPVVEGRKIAVPIKPVQGYAPTSLSITLTGEDAETLRDIGAGMRELGLNAGDPSHVIGQLMQAVRRG